MKSIMPRDCLCTMTYLHVADRDSRGFGFLCHVTHEGVECDFYQYVVEHMHSRVMEHQSCFMSHVTHECLKEQRDL